MRTGRAPVPLGVGALASCRSATLVAAVALLAASGCAHRTWSEVHAGFDRSTSADCLGCYEYTRPVIDAHRSHPVDADYAAAAARSGASLRPLEEVRRLGIVVPEGKVGCRTCHAADSPWKDHLALPAGARPRAAVNPRDPRTYAVEPSPPQPGAAVSPKSLCQACHAF